MILGLLIVIAGFVLLALLAALVFVIGALLPREHVASRSASFTRPPEAVWAVITDHANEGSWREGFKSVGRLADSSGHPVWKEVDERGASRVLETELEVRPNQMVRRIVGVDLPFGGSWSYEVLPTKDGCRLTITERGYVSNPLFRFVSRFFMGHTATIERYLEALGRRLSEDRA